MIHVGEIPFSDRYYVGLAFSDLSPNSQRQLNKYLKERGVEP